MPSAAAPRLPAWFNRLLDNPVLGFAPWMALSLIQGPGRLALAAIVALAMSLLFVLLDWLRGNSVKVLAMVGVLSFAVFLAVSSSVSKPSQHWLETWFGEIANIIIVLIVATSMIERVPFTIQYAQEEVDRDHWQDEHFIRLNYQLTAAWALAFLFAAIAGFIGDAVLQNNSNLWTGWILQIGAYLVAAEFSSWYPRRLEAQIHNAGGKAAERVPSVIELLAAVSAYLIPAGIIALVVQDDPAWVGITLIVAGVVITGWLRRTVAKTVLIPKESLVHQKGPHDRDSGPHQTGQGEGRRRPGC
jgi:hypothetical protein